MLILGNNADDVGAQLEHLTRRLLEEEGYNNIATNSIGAGGLEIDVRADVQIPFPGGAQVRRLIAECKAYRNTVAMTDWLKFLGKVFAEEATHNQEVYGLFVALSGVNGNVSGNYDLIHPLRPRIRLLQGDELSILVRALYGAASAAEITVRLGQLTARRHSAIELVYYGDTVYWLLSFGEQEYTLLSATGDLLTPAVRDLIIPLLQARTAHTLFIDPEAEALARDRAAQLQKRILVTLMETDEPVSADDLAGANPGFSDEDIGQALNLLTQNGWVLNEAAAYRVVPHATENFYALFGAIVLFVLTGRAEVEAVERMMMSPFVSLALSDAFVEHVSQVQGGMPIQEQDRQTILQIVRLSPSALAYSVQPDPMIVTHRVNQPAIVDPNFDVQDAATLLRSLIGSLERDFSAAHFSHYFHTLRGLREIETNKTVAVKSAVETLFERAVGIRLGLGEWHAGGYVHFVIMHNAPQPWEVGGAGGPPAAEAPENPE